MTFSRWKRLLESPEGTGGLLVDGRPAARVRYSLRIEVEDLVAKTFSGEPKALIRQIQTVSGRIGVTDGDADLPIEPDSQEHAVSLTLEDGRSIDIALVDFDPSNGEYIVRAEAI